MKELMQNIRLMALLVVAWHLGMNMALAQTQTSAALSREERIQSAGPMFCEQARKVGMDCPSQFLAGSPAELRRRSTPPQLVLQGDSVVNLRLLEPIDTRKLKAGDQVPMIVTREVHVNGIKVIEQGARAWAYLDVGTGKQRNCRGDSLQLTFGGVYAITGETVPLHGTEQAEGFFNDGCLQSPLVALVFGHWTHGEAVFIPQGTNLLGYVHGNVKFDAELLNNLLDRDRAEKEQARLVATDAIVHVYRMDYDANGSERAYVDFSDVAAMNPVKALLV